MRNRLRHKPESGSDTAMYAVEIRQRDPEQLVEALMHLPYLVFLDSAMRHDTLGRYSFIAADPFGVFSVQDGTAFWDNAPLKGSPANCLNACLERYRTDHDPDLPPLQGGAIGTFSYEFAHCLEALPDAPEDEISIPPVLLPFYDVVIAYDHSLGRCWLISTGWPETDSDRRKTHAQARADMFLTLIEASETGSASSDRPLGNPPVTGWQSNKTRPDYEAAIARTVDYILAGDIFQANITQRFMADEPAGFDRWAYYKTLRQMNAAPFAAYLAFGDITVASSSPERFLQVSDRHVETRPIKGTVKRSPNLLEDEKAAQILLNSEKDKAENVMIVDLLRNDLSKVCEAGSVDVPVLCGLESYASVHHLVSVVTGTLKPGHTAADLLSAGFPGGSITGAPKVRAMEIITELEALERTLYCGSIGYLGFSGHSDTNIVIRTVLFSNGKIAFHAGGGITALSEPSAEYDESLTKAQRLFASFGADASCLRDTA
ncbi:aminodeoxychorismate synthase component I [Coralliovum pocilloporae]|uniref:aminodeoxychorismate synthase component I n=1 Tax=Coralliovum pocilloporae TaxID=3066369 RepID=UPI0033071040